MFFREEYIAPIPEPERRDMILAYHAQLNSADAETRRVAAAAWSKWERVSFSQIGQQTRANRLAWISRMQTSKLCVDPANVARADNSEFAKYVDNIVDVPVGT